MSPRSKQFQKIVSPSAMKGFQPIGVPFSQAAVVTLLYEEYEALRLADYSGLKQEEAAALMNISRPTFTRNYSSCLKKLAVEFDKQWYRCHKCSSVFHHPDAEHKECINCHSEDIEHINQSISDWKEEQGKVKPLDVVEYCTCPQCKTPLIRKRV